MDYETKPISRSGLRSISKFVRQMFGCKSDNVPFPVIDALERLPDLFPDTNCVIVNDNELPGNVFACCSPKSEGGFVIKIKQTVYDDAYKNKNPAFLLSAMRFAMWFCFILDLHLYPMFRFLKKIKFPHIGVLSGKRKPYAEK